MSRIWKSPVWDGQPDSLVQKMKQIQDEEQEYMLNLHGIKENSPDLWWKK